MPVESASGVFHISSAMAFGLMESTLINLMLLQLELRNNIYIKYWQYHIHYSIYAPKKKKWLLYIFFYSLVNTWLECIWGWLVQPSQRLATSKLWTRRAESELSPGSEPNSGRMDEGLIWAYTVWLPKFMMAEWKFCLYIFWRLNSNKKFTVRITSKKGKKTRTHILFKGNQNIPKQNK